MIDPSTAATSPDQQAARPRRVRRWIIASVLGVAIIVSVWRLLCFNLWDSEEFKPAPVWDGKPRFAETTYSQRGDSSNATLWQRMFMAYLDFQRRHGKKNPAAWSFPATPPRLCSIHGLLNQCMEVTGTRYLMAYEASAGSVQFGHSNVLNGAQWVAAFEAALQTNQPGCFDYSAKSPRPENLLLIREKPGVVKVIPPSRLAEYQKAGLVDASYQPEATTPPIPPPR
jgi:hypothetical protein